MFFYIIIIGIIINYHYYYTINSNDEILNGIRTVLARKAVALTIPKHKRWYRLAYSTLSLRLL